MAEVANPRYVDALSFTVRCHGAQTRKGTDFPYPVHLLRVAETLDRFGYSEDVVVAGFLHDTVEDAGVTHAELSERFGPRVAELVAKASEPDKSLGWRERKQHTINGIRDETDVDALALVAADKLDNIRSIGETLRAQGPERTWARFNSGPDGQRWYYRGLADALLERLPDERLARELAAAVDDVFPPADG
jgi:(p)ppGpp synthase/HD superfamily hydrolase